MSAAAQFAYLDTRVSVLAGRLLRDEDVAGLLQTSGAGEGAAVLRKVGLTAGGEAAPPAALEQAVITALVREVQVLARPLTGTAREVLQYWARRFELVNLKIILRALAAGLAPEAIRRELLDLDGMESLPVDAAVHADDVAELLRRLGDSPYAEMARRARDVYEQQRGTFSLEAALDREYFTGLVKRAGALPDAAGRHLRRLVGVLIDQMNLIWMLRFRHVYGLEPAHVFILLIPTGRYLDSRRLLSLVKLEAVDDVLPALPDPLRRLMTDVHSIEEAETAMRRETRRVARCILGYTTFNVARPCAYLLLREWQLWEIYGMVEGARLGLDEALVRSAVRLGAAGTAG